MMLSQYEQPVSVGGSSASSEHQPHNQQQQQQQEQQYSYSNAESWRYGEEASLYSIAEDSREDRASEIPSVAGSVTGGMGDLYGGPSSGNAPAHYERDTKIEVQWNVPSSYCTPSRNIDGLSDDKDMEQATNSSGDPDDDPDGGGGSLMGSAYVHPNHEEKPYRNSRRCKLFALAMVLLAVVIAVALGVALSQGKTASQSESATGSSPSGVGAAIDEAETQQPDQTQQLDEDDKEDSAGGAKSEGDDPPKPAAEEDVELDSSSGAGNNQEDNVDPNQDETVPDENGNSGITTGSDTVDGVEDDIDETVNAPEEGVGEDPVVDNGTNELDDPADQWQPTLEEDTNQGTAGDTGSSNNGGDAATSSESAKLLVENFVWTALSLCTEEDVIKNPSTKQNFVFRTLVDEVLAASTVNANGLVDIPLDIGFSMLMERYALGMLFVTSNGPGWIGKTGWMSESDVCEWYGVDDCEQRTEGSCAVTGLTLRKY